MVGAAGDLVETCTDVRTCSLGREPADPLRAFWAIGNVVTGGLLTSAAERRRDLGREQVEVELGGLLGFEGFEAKPFPPAAGAGVQRRHDDRATSCLLVEFDRGGQDMRGEGGADAERPVAVVDRQATEQQRGDGVGCALVKLSGAVDRSIPIIATLA
jgi:hypothetical protein